MSVGGRVARALGATMLVLFALGLALQPLLAPAFTRALSARHSLADAAGFSDAEVAVLAEQVRAFVAGEGGALPADAAGMRGFDEAAVSHLEDVAAVIVMARLATGALAAALGLACWATVRRAGWAPVADVLRAGGVAVLAGVGIVAVLAALAFDAAFSAFHAVFFEAGTWTFPSDSLLIRLFPEPFWGSAAVAWGVLIALVGAVYLVAASVLRRSLVGGSGVGASHGVRRAS